MKIDLKLFLFMWMYGGGIFIRKETRYLEEPVTNIAYSEEPYGKTKVKAAKHPLKHLKIQNNLTVLQQQKKSQVTKQSRFFKPITDKSVDTTQLRKSETFIDQTTSTEKLRKSII